MAETLVDTDVFADHLRGQRRLVVGEDQIFYSIVTRAELFAGRDGDEQPIEHLLGPFGEIPIDRSIAELAGRLRRHHGVSLPDALIAATALERDLVLVTRNKRDFERVPGVRVTAPIEGTPG